MSAAWMKPPALTASVGRGIQSIGFIVAIAPSVVMLHA